MSVYGYSLPTTPRLDEITRTWTVFENAHTAATSTTAAQPAILTGRYPYTDEWHRYGDLARAGKGLLNLPRILQAAGYETTYAMGGGWPPSRYHLHTGFDRILGGGFPAFQRPGYAVHRFPGRDLLNRTLWNSTIAEALLSWQPAGPAPRPLSYDEPIIARRPKCCASRRRKVMSRSSCTCIPCGPIIPSSRVSSWDSSCRSTKG